MDKSVIINRIIKEVGATKYLEIGFGTGHNYDKIEVEHGKWALDCTLPTHNKYGDEVVGSTSDNFFVEYAGIISKGIDVVFIDGDHTCDQVRKDIINSMKVNAKAIILHDTIPHSKAMQEVPRNTKEWTGDVWRAVVGFKQSYPDVKIETYRSDYGLSVIYPEGKKVKKHFENKEMTYGEFKANEVELLNIID